MKSKRHEKILELIRDHDIETQEQLLQQLQESGFNTTQATISRDIKQLRIIKELGPGGTYRYSATAKPVEHAFSSKLNIIFSQCVTSVDYAQNIIVIKTLPGLAQAACSALDKLDLSEVLGTLGGDDTCMVVLRDAASAAGICAEIRSQITIHETPRISFARGEPGMLSVLHIENIAVIEQAEILFEGGFNVLTGETGAGKSIVIDAISAILGERTYRDVIRTGANRAFVSAIFTNIPQYDWFSENQVEFDPQELQVQREIYADGRNVCRVNGRPVSVASLKKLGGRLINIHGQHDSQQLFDEENHLTYLDAFARDEQELEAYQQAFAAMQSVQREIQKLSMDESEKLRLVETLTFQIEEIRAANLVSGEEEQLKERRKVLQNAEKLSDALRMADEALYGGDSSDGAAGLLSNAEHALSRVSTISADMQTLHQKISDLMYSVQDAADELRAMRDDLSYSEGELEEIEERLDAIHKLKRKYGASVEDVLAYLADSEQRLDEIEFASDRIETAQKTGGGTAKGNNPAGRNSA